MRARFSQRGQGRVARPEWWQRRVVLMFVIPWMALSATGCATKMQAIDVRVRDAATGEPVRDARVLVGNKRFFIPEPVNMTFGEPVTTTAMTNAEGMVRLRADRINPNAITVLHPDFPKFDATIEFRRLGQPPSGSWVLTSPATPDFTRRVLEVDIVVARGARTRGSID